MRLLNNINNMSASSIPLRNNFLKAQSNASALLAKSKADFIAALDASIGAWEHINDDGLIPQGLKDQLNSLVGLKDGLSKLKTAINNGQTFYFSDDFSGNTWPGNADHYSFGVNMAHFFTPGFLGIDKIIELEDDDRSPKFYGIPNKGDPAAITSAAQLDTYDGVSFALKTKPFADLVVGFEDLTDIPADATVVLPIELLPIDLGKALYQLYH
jgi:hypothetical protein